MDRAIEIEKRLATIKSGIGNATLIAVSKYTTIEDIQLAHQSGHRDFGESRVQDLIIKSDALDQLNIDWHFIGRLQTNKINALLKVNNLKYIHSIDSIHLLEALIKRMDLFQGEQLGVFLQFNTSGEGEKGGFNSFEDLIFCKDLIDKCEKLKLTGLMTIGRIRTENFEGEAKKSFSLLADLKEKLNPELKLSMGMSSDYKMALDAGSNFIRIGSAIFE